MTGAILRYIHATDLYTYGSPWGVRRAKKKGKTATVSLPPLLDDLRHDRFGEAGDAL